VGYFWGFCLLHYVVICNSGFACILNRIQSCNLEQVLEQQKLVLLLGFIGFSTTETKLNRTKISQFEPVLVLNFFKKIISVLLIFSYKNRTENNHL